MSVNQQVREFFSSHIGEKFDNAMLRQALDTDEAQAISVALNVMHTNGEISREKRPAGPGYLYWMGVASKTDIRTVKGSATVDDDEPPPENAKVKPTTKKEKRKYKKRAPPIALPTTLPAPSPAALPAIPSTATALFAIRDDGMVGIALGNESVSLPAAEVQRLQNFLKTVSPLWN